MDKRLPKRTHPHTELIEAAVSARKNAYCPYSRYSVGAAVLTEDGELFTGCNIENASYGLSLCAERVAVFNAMSRKRVRLAAVCVAARLSTPCGACRQVLAEFAAPELELYLVDINLRNGQRRVRHVTLKELLPIPFDPLQAGLIKL
ncbi:MAG: cytidine deaminase [Elusimicrobia bacterium]|nr:cytidine deaminase [Elusimicrobiota bacterium]